MKTFKDYVDLELCRFNALYAQRVSSFYAKTDHKVYTDAGIFEDFESLRHHYRSVNFDINEHLFMGLSKYRQQQIRLGFNDTYKIMDAFDDLIASL